MILVANGHVVVAEVLEPESVTLVSIANYTGDAAGITSTYQTKEYFHSIKYMKNRVRVVLVEKQQLQLSIMMKLMLEQPMICKEHLKSQQGLIMIIAEVDLIQTFVIIQMFPKCREKGIVKN